MGKPSSSVQCSFLWLDLVWQFRFIKWNRLVKYSGIISFVSFIATLLIAASLPMVGWIAALVGSLICTYWQFTNELAEKKQSNTLRSINLLNSREQALLAEIEGLAAKANLVLPKIKIIINSGVISFSSGIYYVNGKRKAYLYLSEECLTMEPSLTKEWWLAKISAPLAHEIGHLKAESSAIEYSLSYGCWVACWGLAIPLLSQATIGMAIVTVGEILGIILLKALLCEALMRNEEYFADAFSALLLDSTKPIYKSLLPERLELKSSPSILNKFSQALKTHPTRLERINYLLEKVGPELAASKRAFGS